MQDRRAPRKEADRATDQQPGSREYRTGPRTPTLTWRS